MNLFLSYYPLKQGLKHPVYDILTAYSPVFTLLSIKTRIETQRSCSTAFHRRYIFILLSIKTRIETPVKLQLTIRQSYFYPTIH